MTRSELVTALAAEKNISLDAAEAVVLVLFGSMTEDLISGKGVEIRGFGSFSIRDYNGRVARNPKSGEAIKVIPKKRPFFKTGKNLKDRILNSAAAFAAE